MMAKPEIAVGYYLNPGIGVQVLNNNFSPYATAELSDPNYITTGDVEGGRQSGPDLHSIQ